MNNVYIRVDANVNIASGHVMRCLSIADQLRNIGAEAVFITADEKSKEMIQTRGYSVIVLYSEWNEKENELPKLKELIAMEKVHVLLIDSYQATKKYLEELNTVTKVIYMDDMYEMLYDVTGIISYGFPDKMDELRNRYMNCGYESPNLWLGLQYTPLREEFMNIPEKHIREKIQDVMITTGGTDAYHISNILIDHLTSTFPDIHFHVVVGRFFENKEKLREYGKYYSNLTLYENFSAMSELMEKCDLAISAGGTTLNELCACGTPTICYSMAENQVDGVQGFKDIEAMLSVGDYGAYVSNQEFLEVIKKALQMMYDQKLRQKYSSNMKKLVDGKGAKRIAEILSTI